MTYPAQPRAHAASILCWRSGANDGAEGLLAVEIGAIDAQLADAKKGPLPVVPGDKGTARLPAPLNCI